MDKKWHDLERLLRRGDRAAALRALDALERGKLGRQERLEAARLYRRAGLPAHSLRMLGPLEEQPTERHRAEYGAALVNLGAIREGMRILDSLRDARDPRIGWIQAAALIREWDWSGAIPLLETLPESGLYLATCLIHGARDYDRAAHILEDALRSPRAAAPDDPRLARSTAWLLLAQSRALAGELRDSSLALRQARAALPEAASPRNATVHGWMIRQWELLLELRGSSGRVGGALGGLRRAGVLRDVTTREPWRSSGRGGAALSELLGPVRDGFRALEGWEWARSCPLFAAEMLGDREVLLELHWTTPYPAFRARALRALGERHPLPGPYELRLGPASRYRIDTATGLASAGGRTLSQLKPGQARHRLLLALASDFHRPHRVAELHEKLFPGEGYRPELSADRVSKVMRRLRHWLQEHRIPLAVAVGRGGYRLRSERGCALALHAPDSRGRPPVGPTLGEWARAVRRALGDASFSSAQALRELGGSRRTLARRLSEASAAGLLARSGAGPATVYRMLLGDKNTDIKGAWKDLAVDLGTAPFRAGCIDNGRELRASIARRNERTDAGLLAPL